MDLFRVNFFDDDAIKERVIEERIKYGVSCYDAYSLYDYLAKVIANGCSILADKDYIPAVIYNELNIPIENHTDEDDEKAMKAWREILESISSGFADCVGGEYLSGSAKKFSKAFSLLKKYFFCLWY